MKNPPTMREMCVWSLGQEEPLEEGVATHCSVPAGRMPWTEELAGCWWAVVRGVQSQTRLSRSMVRPGASWERRSGWSCVLPEAVPRRVAGGHVVWVAGLGVAEQDAQCGDEAAHRPDAGPGAAFRPAGQAPRADACPLTARLRLGSRRHSGRPPRPECRGSTPETSSSAE